MRAYLGTTVTGFPNLFLLLGPNTGLGHTSVVLMIEAQLEQVIAAMSIHAPPRHHSDRADRQRHSADITNGSTRRWPARFG